jgi:hypothetical protein
MVQLITAFLMGICCGYLWLSPVVGVPTNEIFNEFLSLDRILRIVAPLMVWILVLIRKKNISLQLSRKILTYLILAMFIFPSFGVIIHGNFSSVISSAIPMIISLLVIIGLSIIEEEILFLFVLGVSLSSCFFLTNGLISAGFESNTFYGRERASLGFVHPVQTGAAILGSMMFVYLVSYYLLNIKKNNSKIVLSFVRFVSAILFLIFVYLLWIADSKNTIIMVLIIFVFSSVFNDCKSRVFVSILLASMIATIYTVSMLKLYNEDIDVLSSFRLSVYNQDLNQFFSSTSSNFLQLFIGTSLSQKSAGFASTDSVYISFLLNFGLIAAISFIQMMTSVCRKLFVDQSSTLPFACFCGIMFFFTFDAQGINPSNLSVFLVFAYPVRIALRENLIKNNDSLVRAL